MGPLAAAKSSSWIQLRQPLEELKKRVEPTANEVVMTTSDGRRLLEGLITNVFVVIDDGGRKRIFTAVEDVLHGHMRSLVLRVCRTMNIDVTMEAPPVELIKNWTEVFLTSKCSSRLRA